MFKQFDADLEFDADKENMTQEQYQSQLAISQKQLSDGEKVHNLRLFSRRPIKNSHFFQSNLTFTFLDILNALCSNYQKILLQMTPPSHKNRIFWVKKGEFWPKIACF